MSFGKTMIFSGGDPEHGQELWKTDGTTLLKDFRPGPPSTQVNDFQLLHNAIYFGLDNGEIWRTDATANGTKFFADILPGSPASDVDVRLFSLGNSLIFKASLGPPDDVYLWRSDGKTTQLLARVPTSGNVKDGFGIDNEAIVGRSFYHVRGDTDTLIRVDANGKQHNLARLAQPQVPAPTVESAQQFDLVDNEFSNRPRRLFCIKGDTVTLIKTAPQPDLDETRPILGSAIQEGNGLLFCEMQPARHRELLWHTDGTVKGTTLLAKFKGTSSIAGFTSVGSEACFINAANAERTTQAPDSTLWKSDGTPKGTMKVTTFQHSATVSLLYFSSIAGTRTLYITVDDDITGREVWRSDGTSAGTFMLRDILR